MLLSYTIKITLRYINALDDWTCKLVGETYDTIAKGFLSGKTCICINVVCSPVHKFDVLIHVLQITSKRFKIDWH